MSLTGNGNCRRSDDARRWVLEQVEDFASQAQANLHKLAPFYEYYESVPLNGLIRTVGLLSGRARIVTHQSMSLEANGLKVFVNAELKPATDRLKSVVRRSGNILRDTLQDLHVYGPFEMALHERNQRQASLYDYTPKICLHSSMLADVNTREVAWHAFSHTVQQLPLLQVSIERLYRPQDS